MSDMSLSSICHLLAEYIRSLKVRVFERRSYAKIIEGCSPYIILAGSPDYGNLGDHAIADTENKFIRDRFPEYDIAEISWDQYKYDNMYFKKHIFRNSLICITGGGYMGSLYPNIEDLVQDIINTFNDNPIIIFPQTIYFSDSINGNIKKEAAWKIYKKHPRLFFCLREKNSYELMRELYPEENNIKLIPDMVMYSGLLFDSFAQRDGALLCLRTDKERTINDDLYKTINNTINRLGLKELRVSTYSRKRISFKVRQRKLKNLINQFAKAKLVITDRLHGMLFALLTGTPCIALDNLSGKVAGVYSWIEGKYSIILVDDTHKLESAIEEINQAEPYCYNNEAFMPRYDMLEKIMSDALNDVY